MRDSDPEVESMNSPGRFLALGVSAAAFVAVSVATLDAGAASVIKRPGAHPKYSVELEPHGLIQYGDTRFGDAGFGLGFRASIPIIDNGPITKINNSMGISFGIDWSHIEDNCGYYFGQRRFGGFDYRGWDCTSNQLWFPVVWQWNFWLTDIISVFGELGFALRHETVSIDDPVCDAYGDCDDSDLDLRPFFSPGARFMFGDTVGLTVRLGWPMLTVGASFLL
jgi:hypothetical protein